MAKTTSIEQYWHVYGGLRGLFNSAYFKLACAIFVVSIDFWWIRPDLAVPPWREIALDLIPSVIGFALSGMAIMLAFSTDRFLYTIKQGGKDDSYLMKVIASFFHLVLVLVLCLFCSIFLNLEFLPRCFALVVSGVGFFAFSYGVLLIVSTASALWHTARIFNRVSSSPPDDGDGNKSH